MKNFLVIYTAPASAMAAMENTSKEDQAKGMEAWMAWQAKNKENVVDFGAPLMPGQVLDKSGNWATCTKDTTGYSIVKGTDSDSVKAIFADHPHLSWAEDCTIEVYETVAM